MTDGVNLGSAYAQIDLDLSPLQRAVRDAQRPLNQLDRSLDSVGKSGQQSARLLDLSSDALGRAGREANEAVDQLRATSRQMDRTGASTKTLRGGISGLAGGLGALGGAFAAVGIVDFGRQALTAANELETTQASVRALAGDQETYNEILRLANEQQRLYGGSLAQNIAQLGGLANSARQAGVGIGEINQAAQRLLVLDPAAQFEDAAIALREALAGDITSLAERFELPRSALRELTDETLTGAEKMALLDDVLSDLGATSEAVTARANTTAQSYRDLSAAIEQATTSIGGFISQGLAPAARGLTRVIENSGRALQSFDDIVDELQAGTRGMERFTEAQNAYNTSSQEIQDEYAGQAASLRELQQQHRDAIETTYEVAQAQGTSSQAYRDALEAANELSAELSSASHQLAIDVQAEADIREQAAARAAEAARQRAIAERRAAGDIQGALALMREAAGLTEEAYEELADAAKAASEEGAQAFGRALQNEVAFLEERQNAEREHGQALVDIRRDYEQELAELQEASATAETQTERDAIAEQMVILGQAYTDRKAAAQEAYAAEEQHAAEAYARQQAAQLAHLGQMLIDYTTAQAQMAGISQEKISEMTAALAREYGVQQSLAQRSYGQMQESVDAWIANNGENTEAFIEHQGRIRNAATQTQQEVDAAIATMTEQARAQFEAGEIDAQEYAERLRQIPGEAESAAAGTVAALGTIPREIVTTWTLKEGSKGGIADVKSRAAAVPQSVTQFDTGNIPGRALGGPVSAGQPYMVGERGPELLVPATNGTVVPAAQTAAMMGGGGGVNVGGINVTIQGAVVDNAARLQEMADMIAGKVQGAVWQTMSTALDDVAMQGVL